MEITLRVRVSRPTFEKLQDLAEAEDAPVSHVVRRALRQLVGRDAQDSSNLAHAHEGPGQAI